jgi:hypothetical protein
MKHTLTEIAATMYQELRQRPFGHARYPLSGGLVIILSRNEPRWRLTLRRLSVYPSEREVAICARAFSVAVGTEPARRVQTERVSAQQTVIWYCIDLIWREIEETAPTTATAPSASAATA